MNILFSKNDIDFFKTIIIEAGDLARHIQSGLISVRRKQDSTIVTQADITVQDLLIEKLSRRYGSFAIISEENIVGAVHEIADDTISIIIDPIDGTGMYSMYLPDWCVSIGIFRGHTPLYGFVYSPGYNMLFHNDDEGAYLNGIRRRVNKNMVVDTESNIFFASEIHNKFFIDFPGKVRNLGSTALHACLTIDNERNRTLAFIGKSRIWDWAGAVSIIQKAGGNIKYITGDEINFQGVMENNYRLMDYAVVYNTGDFKSVEKIFQKINPRKQSPHQMI